MPFNSIGPMELVIVLVIALIVLGPKRLPEAGRAVGKGLREFKDSLSGSSHDDDEDDGEPSALGRADGTFTPR
jgi:sec-independent protein translocase protein TatA